MLALRSNQAFIQNVFRRCISGTAVCRFENAGNPVAQDNSETVITRGVTGIVKSFSLETRYGFITRDDTQEDVFVHFDNIVRRGRTRFALDKHLQIEFDVIATPRGKEAIGITLPGGFPIENTRIAPYKELNRSTNPSGFRPRRTDENAKISDELFEELELTKSKNSQ